MPKKVLPTAMAAAALTALTVLPAVPAAAAATAEVTIRVERSYTETVQEWRGIPFTCPTNQVLTGRMHTGDENGPTTYYCSWILVNGEQAQVLLGDWNTGQKEKQSNFVAPPDQAIAGRWHTGDENGITKYRTAAIYWQGRQLRLTSPVTSSCAKESNCYSEAGAGRVMTGRSHTGDENGSTSYRYSLVTLEG
ncbi:hypothetical protein [Streptosporangium pseudovulgare]|uniref:Uncharacterized protein n=1 Tax=Streptosporangium pseudovulgare TaxID=35765 RepID=A0ABQ2RGM2_9ACTN|nr:hypothetical protein [Streptosporangium pseudovulgare]GGQ27228.1 hypothetical protein GCM10010140_66720 [Streptosporangium pseudovulgare]